MCMDGTLSIRINSVHVMWPTYDSGEQMTRKADREGWGVGEVKKKKKGAQERGIFSTRADGRISRDKPGVRDPYTRSPVNIYIYVLHSCTPESFQGLEYGVGK